MLETDEAEISGELEFLDNARNCYRARRAQGKLSLGLFNLLESCWLERRRPSRNLLRRVFHEAVPGLRLYAREQKKKDMWVFTTVREYWALNPGLRRQFVERARRQARPFQHA